MSYNVSTIVLTEHSEEILTENKEQDTKEIQSDVHLTEQDQNYLKQELVGTPDEFMGEPTMLGITAKNNKSDGSFSLKANFYTGATWLIKDKLVAVVKPKVENIDYMKMFTDALMVSSDKESEYFSKCYGIDFDGPEIEVDASLNIISPMIMLHYIYLLKSLVKKGLKKGYVSRESNLQSKIKGRILFSTHLRKNILGKREDRNYCKITEFTTDIPENRLLKKALNFVNVSLKQYTSFCNKQEMHDTQLVINQVLPHFTNISDDVTFNEVQKNSSNKLFSAYSEAIRIAKLILRHFDLEIHEDKSKKTVFVKPFWIDMPRLYELYVYGILKKIADQCNETVIFQAEGYYQTKADYVLVNKKMILDAKYKPHYENGNRGLIYDVREMSGYARDTKILEKIKVQDNSLVQCVILYPKIEWSKDERALESKFDEENIEKTNNNNNIKDTGSSVATDAFDIFFSKSQKFKCYKEFYKLAIDVPRTVNF